MCAEHGEFMRTPVPRADNWDGWPMPPETIQALAAVWSDILLADLERRPPSVALHTIEFIFKGDTVTITPLGLTPDDLRAHLRDLETRLPGYRLLVQGCA